MEWNGTQIVNEITVNKIKLLIGNNEIIIIPRSKEENVLYIEFYFILRYVLELVKEKPMLTYGIFLNKYLQIERKKCKQELLENLNPFNYIFLLEGDNPDSYYTNKREVDDFYGVEFRYSISVKEMDWEKERYNIYLYIKENSKNFEKFEHFRNKL